MIQIQRKRVALKHFIELIFCEMRDSCESELADTRSYFPENWKVMCHRLPVQFTAQFSWTDLKLRIVHEKSWRLHALNLFNFLHFKAGFGLKTIRKMTVRTKQIAIWDCFVKIRSCAKMSYIWKIFLCEWWSRFKEKRLLWNISVSLFSVRWGIRLNLNFLTHYNTSQKTEKLCVTGSLANFQSNFHELASNSGLYMKIHEDFMHWICLIFFISRQDSAWKPSEKWQSGPDKANLRLFCKNYGHAPRWATFEKFFSVSDGSRFKEKRLLWNISLSLLCVRLRDSCASELADTR